MGAAGGGAAESAGVPKEGKKEGAWRSHAVGRVEADRPEGRAFRTPAELARVRAQRAALVTGRATLLPQFRHHATAAEYR